MNAKGYSEVTIENIGDGIVPELFERELAQVLDNISDINTDRKEKREITIKFTIIPNDEREVGFVDIKCTSKLPGAKAKSAVFHIANNHGKKVAMQENFKQNCLFGNDNVTDFADAASGGEVD